MAHYAEKWSSAVQKQIGRAFAIVRSVSATEVVLSGGLFLERTP